ncbi:Glutathione S-transferase 1-1 [Papilio xuthus]|uniref:Glutathione S-transferase 1-1 n=1 Tax=Papilio xuthus TaxID=66420 RepID=A0A194QLP8_PAPXU|nr:Glutathione S-transferase 1-1 [Papilio xuthus]
MTPKFEKIMKPYRKHHNDVVDHYLEATVFQHIAMTIDFYYLKGSPPCAVVSLIFAEVGIESQVNSHYVNIEANEHLKEEYLKINPQHTAPTIVDDGLVLAESRAIAKYLVAKYGNNKYYPQDINTRALIDQRLDFDIGTLYARLGDVYYSLILGSPMNENQLNKLDDAFNILNNTLEGNKYAVGSEPTLADISLAVTVLVFEAFKVNIKRYNNITR